MAERERFELSEAFPPLPCPITVNLLRWVMIP